MIEEQTLLQRVTDLHYIAPKQLKDGRVAAVQQFIFTTAILTFSDKSIHYGYEDRWCYHDKASALKALSEWEGDGDPTGWHRHPATGRRRDNGDPLKEYINL